MENSPKEDLKQRVVLDGREYGINTVLFRHAVGEILGVNVTDMECLALLFFKGISSPTELSRHTGLSSGATTIMLDRLEKAGLVKRSPNPADRRGVLISVAPESEKTVGPLFASVRNAQNKLVSSFSTTELEIVSRYLRESAAMWEAERINLQKNTFKK